MKLLYEPFITAIAIPMSLLIYLVVTLAAFSMLLIDKFAPKTLFNNPFSKLD